MSCNCNSPFQSPWACPDQTDPWAAPTENPLKVAVFDSTTNTVRALLPHETPPSSGCGGTPMNIGQLPTSKVMQDAYLELVTRLRMLEEKYCNCICGDSPAPTPEPVEQEPDSWRSDVIEYPSPSNLYVPGVIVEFPKDYDFIKIRVVVLCDSYLEGDFSFDHGAALESLNHPENVMVSCIVYKNDWQEYDGVDTYTDRGTVVFDAEIASSVQGVPLSECIEDGINAIHLKTRSSMYDISRIQVLVSADKREPIHASVQLIQPS